MARNNTLTEIPQRVWTPLTNADATAVRVQNRSPSAILLSATNGATEPSDLNGALELGAGQTMAADLTLAQLWPGVSGANRLWAWSDMDPLITTVSVSHA
ncbi:MAG: hypothetical protein IPM06_20115 [Rhizobiales bacterium]|nr:hypothetical protein [Hyphomicrobiales bacterium]